MHITMKQDHEDSLNDGRTRQRFEAGKTYDVPDEIGQAWGDANVAEPVGARHAVPLRLTPRASRQKKEN